MTTSPLARDEEKTVLTRWLWSKRNDGFLLGSPICGLYNDPESIDGPSTRRSQTQPRLGFNDGFLRASFHPDLICARTLCNVLDPKDRPNSGEDPVAVVTRSHDTVVGKHMCPHEQDAVSRCARSLKSHLTSYATIYGL